MILRLYKVVALTQLVAGNSLIATISHQEALLASRSLYHDNNGRRRAMVQAYAQERIVNSQSPTQGPGFWSDPGFCLTGFSLTRALAYRVCGTNQRQYLACNRQPPRLQRKRIPIVVKHGVDMGV